MPVRGNRTGTVLEVAAGVLFNTRGEVLISQRSQPAQFRGKWEFPGGKMEPGESVDDALYRELLEELDIQIKESEPLISIFHQYPHATIRLHVRKVTDYSGNPLGNEGQAIRWAHPAVLHEVNFLDANEPILNAVYLPQVFLIVDVAKFGGVGTTESLAVWLKESKCIVQVRDTPCSQGGFSDAARQVVALCRQYGALVLANIDPVHGRRLGFDGVHLPADKIGTVVTSPGPGKFWLGASCSSADEIESAATAGADFAVFSSARSTGSQSLVLPAAWSRFSQLCYNSRIPIYIPGGMNVDDSSQWRNLGAQGVAVINTAWR